VNFLHAESEDYSGPMIDGKVIPCDVDQGFLEDREARLPLLTGTTDDELGTIPSIFAGFVSNKVIAAFGERGAGLAAYYGSGKSRPTDLVSDAAFVEPARFVAGRHGANHSPVWLYRFGYVATDKRDGDAGARHTGEIPYIFGTLQAYGITPTAEDVKMSDAVQDYWVAFARSGNPNSPGASQWPNYAPTGETLMSFGKDGAIAGPDPAQARLDYIDQSYPPSEQ
jgi:para-nitrobenzyl esterase